MIFNAFLSRHNFITFVAELAAHVAKLVNVAVSEAVVIRLRSSSLLVGTVKGIPVSGILFFCYPPIKYIRINLSELK